MVCLLGVWLRYSQESSKISGTIVRYSRYIHGFAGIGLWTLAQCALLVAWYEQNPTVFTGLLIYSIVFIVLRTLYRYYPFQIQSKAKDYQTEDKGNDKVRVVTKKSDLKIYSRNYCVFSDYVYSLDGVYNTHPGGYQIISNIK